MDRRRFVLTSLAGAVATPLAAGAQQSGRIHQIGYLAVRSASDSFPFSDALRHGLSELGWVEGRNIVIEYRFSEGRYDRMHTLAAELVLLKVDVMVAEGTAAAAAAKGAIRTIPIVATSISDPVGIGLIASLARPSGNVTGLSYSVGNNETVVKSLELLRETVPEVRRVAILSLAGQCKGAGRGGQFTLRHHFEISNDARGNPHKIGLYRELSTATRAATAIATNQRRTRKSRT